MLSSSVLGLLCLAGMSLATTTATRTTSASSSTRSLPAVPTATDLRGNVSFSTINQRLTFPDIPPHMNLTCLNCSTSGVIELVAGGYNVNDSAPGIAMDFFDDGFLKFVAHGLGANISTSIALSPGFQLVNIKVPLFKKHIFTLPMGKLGNINIFFEVFIPMIIQLNSEVDILPQLTLSVPENATMFLDFGNRNNSYITGFNESTLTPSFDLTSPNISFTMLTGLDYLLSAKTTIGNPTSNSAVDFIADFSANLGLPILNTTVRELNHVNGTCDPPRGNEQVYDKAIGVEYAAQLGLNLNGLFSVEVGNFSEQWAPPAINAFNHTFPLPTGCYKFDPLATGLIAATATPKATSAPSGQSGDASSNGTDSSGQGKKTNTADRARAISMAGASVMGMVMFAMALAAM